MLLEGESSAVARDNYPERGASGMEIMCATLFLVVATGYIIVVAQQAKK